MKTYKIAIIDDNPIDREMLIWHTDYMPQCKFKTYKSGEDFLKDKKAKHDIIIMDYQLNGEDPNAMNGLELMNRIEKTPVIIMSSQKHLNTLVEFIREGAIDYVEKNDALLSNIETSLLDIMEAMETNEEIEKLQQTNRSQTLKSVALIAIALLSAIIALT